MRPSARSMKISCQTSPRRLLRPQSAHVTGDGAVTSFASDPVLVAVKSSVVAHGAVVEERAFVCTFVQLSQIEVGPFARAVVAPPGAAGCGASLRACIPAGQCLAVMAAQ
jgi:hypothetical protein